MTTEASASVPARMADAAAVFLSALDAEQRARASFAFSDTAERRDWAYFPRDFHGVPLLAMTPRQRKAAHRLVSAALSLEGYAKVNAIIALESVLDRIEEHRLTAVRDPGRYFLSIFGAPEGHAPWGWRFEGHHVSLNFTFVDGVLAGATPIFLGANPAEVRRGGHLVSRPLAEEEDIGRALLLSLDVDQRRDAMICDVAPPDFVLMNLPEVPKSCTPGDVQALPAIKAEFDNLTRAHREALRFERARPRGLPASRMDAAQRALLAELVRAYVERLSAQLSVSEMSRIQRSLDALYFAWAGEEAPHRPHYYRVHGPGLLIEYDNTQDRANHVHAVWRNPDGDFGADLLRQHVLRNHRSRRTW